MDFSKFKTSDWMKIGGAAGFVVFGFLGWVKVSVDGFGSDTGNVFDFFWTGTVPWILVVASGVVTLLLASGTMKPGNVAWTPVMLAGDALAAALVLVRVLFNPLEGKDVAETLGVDISRSAGLYLSAIAVIVALLGALKGFTESGGKLADLKDPNKLKNMFGAGGDTLPPPPIG